MDSRNCNFPHSITFQYGFPLVRRDLGVVWEEFLRRKPRTSTNLSAVSTTSDHLIHIGTNLVRG